MMIDSLTPFRFRRLALRPFVGLCLLLLAGATGPRGHAAPAEAPARAAVKAAKKNFDIPAGDALNALKQFSAQSGEQLIYKTESLDGIRTEAVRGSFGAREALERMLSRTPLSVAQDDKNGVLAIVPAAQAKGNNRSADLGNAADPSSKKKVK